MLASRLRAPILSLTFALGAGACVVNPATKAPVAPDAAASSSPDPATAEIAKANAMFEAIFEEGVARSPETQTALGRRTQLDRWDDLSEHFERQTLALYKDQLARLDTLDSKLLDESTRLSLTLLKQSLQHRIDDEKWRLYNYPVNQMFGTHTDVPSLLISAHRIDNLAQAQAYISRLNNVRILFAQLIEGLKARAAAGIIPPKFVFPHVIRDCENVIKGAPFGKGELSTLAADFRGKLDALQSKDPGALSPAQKKLLLEQADTALTKSVKPAYEDLIAYLKTLEKSAGTDDGVWRWAKGADFYNNALARTTTTKLTADQIHEIGLAEVARIHDEMRKIMTKVGFKGDLAAFMKFMREDPQFYLPNTPEGKKAYLDRAKSSIDKMRARLGDMFLHQPKAKIEVQAVEPFREQSAGKAFYEPGAPDGSRPGRYYANLYDMSMMPTYQLEALAFHEGIPGHHMQISFAQELKDIPTFRKFARYTAYSEGWGLYSELFPREFGFYEDPYSDFGRLAMELWRACRLVVDTGIHAKKWTREQGIAYYKDNTPNAMSDIVKMVERHIVMPSQATAYKIGMLKILELREYAKKELGASFDIRGFHHELLRQGAVPMDVLESNIQTWVSQQKTAKRAPKQG